MIRKKRPLARSTGIVRDATLVVIASEDRYAVKQYFEFFRSSRLQFLVLETTDTKSSPEQVMARLEKYLTDYDVGEGDAFWFVCDTDHWANAGHIKNLIDVFCSNRLRATGCGRTFSVWTADKIKRLFLLNLWMHTLTELWAWNKTGQQLVDREDSPWDDPDRPPFARQPPESPTDADHAKQFIDASLRVVSPPKNNPADPQPDEFSRLNSPF